MTIKQIAEKYKISQPTVFERKKRLNIGTFTEENLKIFQEDIEKNPPRRVLVTHTTILDLKALNENLAKERDGALMLVEQIKAKYAMLPEPEVTQKKLLELEEMEKKFLAMKNRSLWKRILNKD